MKESTYIVQFMHSGVEKEVDGSTGSIQVPWNDGEHRRRLIHHTGACVDGEDNLFENEDLAFWGEWEGETVATPISSNGIDTSPLSARFEHAVVYPSCPPTATSSCGAVSCDCECECAQNTDPCVFGEAFKYSNCHQSQNGKMRKLAKGSIIVFGSRPSGIFHLDTVFVTRDSGDSYKTTDGPSFENLNVSEEYKQLTLRRLGGVREFTLYWGATFEAKVDGMFSFTPTRRYSDPSFGGRCELNLNELNALLAKGGVVEEMGLGQTQGFHAIEVPSSVAKLVWDAIRQQVIDREFLLGVHFDWPTKFSN